MQPLFVGSIGAAKNAEALEEQGVTHVLSLVSSRVIRELDGVKAAAGKTGTVAHHMIIEIDDRPDAKLGRHFDECFAFIDAGLAAAAGRGCEDGGDGGGIGEGGRGGCERCSGRDGAGGDGGGDGGGEEGAVGAGGDGRGGVLVHCFQGKSRSVAIVTGYLMARRGLGFADANDAVRNARPQAKMNVGFAMELRRCERLGWGTETPAPAGGAPGGGLAATSVATQAAAVSSGAAGVT